MVSFNIFTSDAAVARHFGSGGQFRPFCSRAELLVFLILQIVVIESGYTDPCRITQILTHFWTIFRHLTFRQFPIIHVESRMSGRPTDCVQLAALKGLDWQHSSGVKMSFRNPQASLETQLKRKDIIRSLQKTGLGYIWS